MSTESQQPTQKSRDASSQENEQPSLTYWTDTTEGSTFQSEKLRYWTESLLEGADRVLNPCAGVAELSIEGETLRVDINKEANADLHIDFRNLLDHVEEESFDAIVYDPPYTWNQAVNKYGLDISRNEFYFYSKPIKKLFNALLKPGGLFIQFGYTTEAMPPEFGYQLEDVSLFNKLGGQNDYLATAATKPTHKPNGIEPLIYYNETTLNAEAENIKNSNISQGGNGGKPIDVVYERHLEDSSFDDCLSNLVNRWIYGTDRVLHIYRGEPSISPEGETTSCSYDCIDLDSTETLSEADVTETPWNIGKRFGTGVFDVVILDLPYRAFQQNIRTPYKQSTSKSGQTHVDTAIKRSITDIVSGDGGKVIQIGRTATLMSGNDYDYNKTAVGILRHQSKSYDRIVSVDKKFHENLEVVSLGDGEVDRLYQHPSGAPNIRSKFNRTDFKSITNSHFCVHCGNGYFHHPAAYTDCLECGAAPNNLCVDENDTPIEPSGPEGQVQQSDLHQKRLDWSDQIHSGKCNAKTPTYLEASEERVDEVIDELIHLYQKGEIDGEYLRSTIEERYQEEPKSTNLADQAISIISEGKQESKKKVKSELTTLDQFS